MSWVMIGRQRSAPLTASDAGSEDVGSRRLCMLTDHLGIVDHEEARRKNVGDKVLGFFHW
ncbi:hypothetical protein Tco_0827725, partial [Tanacetum coccineum]